MKKPGRPISVLIVETHLATADRTAELLRGRGCVVITALDRDAARDALAGVMPDVVLVGMSPGPRGLHAYEFARELRRLTERKPPLLVAITSARGNAERARLTQAGFDLRIARLERADDLFSHLEARWRADALHDAAAPALA